MVRTGARVFAQTKNTSGVIGVRPRYVMFTNEPYLHFVTKPGRAKASFWRDAVDTEPIWTH